MSVAGHRLDVRLALYGQVKDAPNVSRLTIEQCAIQVESAVMALTCALDWAREGDARKAAHYAEDALRLLEGAPDKTPGLAYGTTRGDLDDAYIHHVDGNPHNNHPANLRRVSR